MRQRLGIARALVNEPQVVFLDEPTLGLDPAGQREVLAIVRRLAHDRGVTVLLSTHLLAEVEETCARVLILNRGRIVAAGDGRGGRATCGGTSNGSAHAFTSIASTRRSRSRALAGWASVERSRRSDEARLHATLVGDAARVRQRRPSRAPRGGVDVLAFEVEGARLSDAFLAMTEAA